MRNPQKKRKSFCERNALKLIIFASICISAAISISLCVAFRENPESPRKHETSTKPPMTTSKPKVYQRDQLSDIDFSNVASTEKLSSVSHTSRKHAMSTESDPKVFQRDPLTEIDLPNLERLSPKSPATRFRSPPSNLDVELQAAIEASLEKSNVEEIPKVIQESFAYGGTSPWMGMYHEKGKEGGDHWQFLPEVQDMDGRSITAPADPGTEVRITEMKDVYRDGDCGYHVIRLMCLKLEKDCQLKTPNEMREDISGYLVDQRHVESVQRVNENPVENYMASEAIEAAAKRYALNIHVVVDNF